MQGSTRKRDLEAAGVKKLFKGRSSAAPRVQLEALIDFARVTFSLSPSSTAARSVRDLMAIVDRLAAKGVGLRILALDLDTSTATGKLMLTILGGIAEFERELMLERQREGIAKAKAEKKYKGRAPTARAKAAEINALLRQNLGPKEISRRLAISPECLSRHQLLGSGLASPWETGSSA